MAPQPETLSPLEAGAFADRVGAQLPWVDMEAALGEGGGSVILTGTTATGRRWRCTVLAVVVQQDPDGAVALAVAKLRKGLGIG